ncbi:putative amidoligase domain-containing protein [Paenibacillus tepidiphilus]|uniref:putative amidoligase domain-containing protein n=1 Tax=Paenibacillus tepidiphilus TaxID=2608683 RepID=UPI00123C44B9|nr:hypothetical protein [Paenibacillus tepidiphilus]
MNEGLDVYRSLSAAGREDRLRRSGLDARLGPDPVAPWRQAGPDTYSSGTETQRLRYSLLVFNLEVVQVSSLGMGRGMTGKLEVGALRSGRETAHLPPAILTGGREAHPAIMEHGAAAEGGGQASPGGEPGRRPGGAAARLASAAVRALQALGLDSGEVRLAAMGERRYTVEAVQPLAADRPLPPPCRAAAEALAGALAQEQPGRPGLLMGMDPEFLLLREETGRVVPATRFLPTDGVAGCDAGPPGTRGAFPVAELRPAPRGTPRALLAQLWSAAATADRRIADRTLAWRAGGMPLPGWALGGHLHFSGVALTAPLLRALDNYLALPLMLLEDGRAADRRPRYGTLGDFRRQPHGGFEYRTLPSFLVSPLIARGAVYLAHLIVSRYEELPDRPLDRDGLHAAFYSGDKALLRPEIPPLLARLRRLDGYDDAAGAIEPLFELIAGTRAWDETRNVRPLWSARTITARPF